MAPPPLTDSAVIAQLGGVPAVAAALGYTEHAVKKWAQRGIPWKDRQKVKRLATQQRKPVPSNFVDERRINR